MLLPTAATFARATFLLVFNRFLPSSNLSKRVPSRRDIQNLLDARKISKDHADKRETTRAF